MNNNFWSFYQPTKQEMQDIQTKALADYDAKVALLDDTMDSKKFNNLMNQYKVELAQDFAKSRPMNLRRVFEFSGTPLILVLGFAVKEVYLYLAN